MAKRRRRRVPEVLWRLFRNQARTLADTILSLLPSPPPAPLECHCKGRRCLGCSGDNAFSFLIRSKDASDYRKLLNQCFVVVPEDAPPFSGFDPHHRWSQLEIVRRSIEMAMCEQPTTLNVISSGYDKSSRLSAIVELLTSSAWSLLLRRVGDVLMVYLLRNTLIFLPLPQRNHHQVAGFPISDLCPRFSGHLSSVEHKQPAESLLGFGRKRKRIDEVDRMPDKLQRTSSPDVDFSSSSVYCAGCNHKTCITPSSRCYDETCYQKSSSGEITKADIADCVDKKVHPFAQWEKTSSQPSTLPMKRRRENSWQRRRKRRQVSFQAISSLIPCAKSLNDRHNLHRKLQSGLSDSRLFYEKTKCPCCLVLQTLPKVIARAQIDRRTMFYKVERSSSVFPRNHILNSLKPNCSGANVLFRHIFGSCDALFTAESTSCFHLEQYSLIKSTCLYHELIKQLKALIRKARSCQHLRLLDKHCVISSLDQNTIVSSGLVTKGGKFERNIEGKKYAGFPVACDLPLEKFHSSNSRSRRKIPEAWNKQFEPSKSYCLKKQVVSFIWAACRSIVPQELLGSPYNWRILRKNISNFICLRRFEKFSLKQCIHKMKATEFPLLSNRHSYCFQWSNVSNCPKNHQPGELKESCKISVTNSVKHKMLQRWIFWFFSHLVVPLLQANFYVTESEHGNQEVYYYKKSIWEKLMSETFTSLKDQSYLQLNEASVRKIIGTRSFGFSRIRLRPRENGFRVLANLKASSRISVKSSLKLQPSTSSRLSFNPRNVKYTYFKPVNKILYDVHVVLKGIQVKEPDMLGSSVFDYNDVYNKFVPFLSLLKSESSSLPGVFVVVADVSKAFDSVNQDKLLSIMKEVISDDEYPLNKYLQVVCRRKSIWVRNHLMVPPQDNIPVSLKCASSSPICAPHSILLKQESSKKIKKEDIFLNLNEHIKRNVLWLGNRFCLQKVGIPQGSILSSLLCSFYYGHLERNVIYPFLDKTCDTDPGGFSGMYNSYDASVAGIICDNRTVMCTSKSLLLRFIDDFLFVSTSRNQASLFLSLLQRGFGEYNCYMNEGKFGLNFEMDHMSRSRSSRFYVGEDGISFLRWSGLLFNCSTLEIQADYTRYLNSHLSSSLTVNRHDHPFRVLMTKLCDYLRPKCHPLFYDSNLNSAGVVRLNIYQAFLLCAMKFHCYISSLSGISTFSMDFYMDAVEKSLRFMHNLIKKRMSSLRLGSRFRPIFEVRKSEIEWLGLTAYSRVLKRKYSRYGELLLLLRSKLMAHREAKSISSALEYAVDDTHSSLIWKIQY